tara:strand:+ start:393 stop:572 length:180 start_codon:yes stop_codon:yes gene_type:complete
MDPQKYYEAMGALLVEDIYLSIRDLEVEMYECVANEEYEEAARLRDVIESRKRVELKLQ